MIRILHKCRRESGRDAPGPRSIRLLAALLCLGASIAILFCDQGTARAAQSQSPVLRVQVDLRSVSLRVTDKKGNDVRGLSAEDFTVLDDHRPQKIAFFGAETVPTSLSILVDSGSSMDSGGGLGSAEAVAAKFISRGNAADEITAMDFTDQFGPFQRLTQSQLLNPSTVTFGSGPSKGSALYDAIAMAVCHLRASKNLRQAIVVITDGNDQNSRITLDQLIALLQSAGAQLFLVGWHIKPEYHLEGHEEKKLTLVSGREIDNPAVVFDRLKKEAGAESSFPGSEADMELALKKVSDLLQAQYTIAYYPENNSKKIRRVEIKTQRSGLVLSVRQSTRASAVPSDSVDFFAGSCQVSPEAHPYPYEPRVSRGDKGIVYREGFSDPRSGWPNHEGSRYVSGGYEITSGVLSRVEAIAGSATPQTGGYMVTGHGDVVAAYGPWWDDFRASAIVDPVMTPSQGSTHPEDSRAYEQDRPAAGLVFRLTGNGYYAVLLSGNPRGKDLSLKLVEKEYGESAETVIIPWSPIDVPQGPRNGTKLSVVAAGSQITIFVNDKQVGTTKDDTFEQGYIGFLVSGAERAVFRDLLVEESP